MPTPDEIKELYRIKCSLWSKWNGEEIFLAATAREARESHYRYEEAQQEYLEALCGAIKEAQT